MSSIIAKCHVLNISFLFCLFSFFHVECAQHSYKPKFLQEKASSKFLAEIIDAANHQQALQHKLVRRQTINESSPTAEDIAFCNAQLYDVACSTGIIQGYIDADLSCGGLRYGGIEEVQSYANQCAKNEGGKYCSSALALYELSGIRRNYIEGNCSEVLASNSCPLTCRTLLEDFSSRLGCCINAYVNVSIYPSSTVLVNYRVWNLCNVPLPPEGCDNVPIVKPPNDVQQCTDEEFYNRFYTQNFCLQQRGQAYINTIVLNNRCKQLYFSEAEYFVNLCTVNADGIPCLTFASSESDIGDLNSDCATTNVSCTLNCSESIRDAKKQYGCCLNFFNTSTDTQPAQAYSVWKSCKIKTPGFCVSPLSLTGLTDRGIAASIMKENHFIILIIAGLICISILYMNNYLF